MDNSLGEQLAIEPIGPGQYQSKHFPPRGGNSAPIAYGGFSIAVAVQAAVASVPATFHLYSAMGNYLSPVSTKCRVVCTVEKTRSTRTFMTRRVLVSQEQGESKPPRVCLDVLADFHIAEPALITYSAPPRMKYAHWKDCLPRDAQRQHMLDAKQITSAHEKVFEKIFGGLGSLDYETRLCAEGVSSQNMLGVNKHAQTTQDNLSLTERTSADWFRAMRDLKSPAEHLGALSFIMDGMLSFLPLTHDHRFFDEVDACSSLDFALRIFVPTVNVNNWHFRECVTHAGGAGRTFSEGRVWDESGTLVASMTQQSIMRPRKQTRNKL